MLETHWLIRLLAEPRATLAAPRVLVPPILGLLAAFGDPLGKTLVLLWRQGIGGQRRSVKDHRVYLVFVDDFLRQVLLLRQARLHLVLDDAIT